MLNQNFFFKNHSNSYLFINAYRNIDNAVILFAKSKFFFKNCSKLNPEHSLFDNTYENADYAMKIKILQKLSPKKFKFSKFSHFHPLL
tara:strand:+ start:80 stop:343 length:264 start_codon:yes stop_codon:yes gene_type:complete